MTTRRAQFLESIYRQFHQPEHIGMDPLDRVRRTTRLQDREIMAWISALLAYGNVKAILGGIDAATTRMNGAPHHFLTTQTPAQIRRRFTDYRYRVTSGRDMAGLLIGLRTVLNQHGRLGTAFESMHDDADETLLPALGRFADAIVAGAGHPLPHLLPHPDKGSACKRPLLALRWLVRQDTIDPGGWNLPTSKLIIPLDVHMGRMAQRLRLTRRKTNTLRTALDITKAFRKICPEDPLRYDFSLTRPGILNVPWKESSSTH